jgi:ribonuclease VapC
LIVDASAILAVLLFEPERDRFVQILRGERSLSVSIINFVEAAIKVDKDPNSERPSLLDDMIRAFGIEIAPVGAELGQIARQAHKQFGRGSGHPARLNFGDCFAYALAKHRNEPLLFKGNDFGKTDIEAAV